MASPTNALRRSIGTTKKLEAIDIEFRKNAWQELKMAMKRTTTSHLKKKRIHERNDSGSTRDVDDTSSVHSFRSLVSESNQNTGKESWGRTFGSLQRKQKSSSIFTKLTGSPGRLANKNVKEKGGMESSLKQRWGDLGATNQLNQGTPSPSCGSASEDSSFLVEEMSASALEGENWHGTVTIGRDHEEQEDEPPSPKRAVTKALKRLNVPVTPPRLKKKKTKKLKTPTKSTPKRRRKSKAEKTNSISVAEPWGDYAMAHHHGTTPQLAYGDLSVPTCPGKRSRNKLRFDDLFEDYFHGSEMTVAWDELLGMGCAEKAIPAGVVDFDRTLVDRILSTSTLPDAPPSMIHDEDSFLGQFYAAYSKTVEEDDEIDHDDENDVEPEVDEREPTESETVETEHGEIKKEKRIRLIHFADEQGLPIKKVHQVGDENDPWAMGRIIVLFLDPVARKFEFMQGEFSHRAGATISDLLRQLPSFATEQRFASMEFLSIYSTDGKPRELGLKEKLHELDLARREVTVAVMKDISGKKLLEEASPVLKNEKIMRAVSFFLGFSARL